MIHVVLDTTVYRSDPRRDKAAFRTLSRLAQAGHVRVHIPEMVRREFLSQEEAQYGKSLESLHSSLRALRRLGVPGHVAEFLDSAMNTATTVSEEVRGFASEAFEGWATQVGAEVHPVAKEHGAKVVAAYFAGELPFRLPKRRDDFPDAFVWQVIRDLADSIHTLYVVSSDEGMLNTVRTNDRIVSYRTLEELIASEPFQALLTAYYSSENFQALWVSLVKESNFVSASIADELVDELVGQTVESSVIPEDNSEARISMVGTPQDIKLDVERVVDHGNGLYVVPFSVSVECILEYAIYKADFYTLREDKARRISIGDLNDHYYEAEESYVLEIGGLLSIELDETHVEAEILSMDLSEEDLMAVIMQSAISLDSVVGIEVAEEGGK